VLVSLQTFQHAFTNPLVLSALGAVAGYFLKAASDVWTSEAKRRQDFATHVIGQIESIAPTYYLMAYHAYFLSYSLNQYLETKRELQLVPVGEGFSPYDDLKGTAEATAKQALFYAGKLYRVISDSFWVKGGRYFLPDRWANKAIEDLHNGLMSVLVFDPQIMLRYIKADTELRDFQDALTRPRKDLREAYDNYREWLLREERQVVQTVAYAQAYRNLFEQQMDRLYKDYYKKGFRWRIPSDDPLRAKDVTNQTPGLFDETRKCIQVAAAEREDRQTMRSRFLVAAIGSDADTLTGEAAFNLAWNFYRNQQYEQAIISYQYALKKLPLDSPLRAATHNNLGNVYTSDRKYELAAQEYEKAIKLDDKRPVFHRDLGSMHYKNGSFKPAVMCYANAGALELEGPAKVFHYNDMGNALSCLGDDRWEEAIENYRRAIALRPLEPVLYGNLADVYQKQGKYDLAISAAKESVNLSTGEQAADYHFRLGCLYESLGQPRWNEAVRAYLEAVNCNPDIKYVSALVEACRKSGMQKAIPGDTAARMSKKAIPRKLDDCRRLADIYASLQDDTHALDEYERWIRLTWWQQILENGATLRYKMAANQILIYRMEVQSVSYVVGPGERQQEPLHLLGTTQQKLLSVNKDGSYEIELTVKAAPAPDQVMKMVMAPNGVILASSAPSATPPTLPFPDKVLRKGDTWANKLPIPGPSGESELTLIYRLADIEVMNGRICAHITVSDGGPNAGVGENTRQNAVVGQKEGIENQVEQRVNALGDTWFDFEKGALVKSHVEVRTVLTARTEGLVTLCTLMVDVELLEDKILEPGASDQPSLPQNSQT